MLFSALLTMLATAQAADLGYNMYLTGWHNYVPGPRDVAPLKDVSLAFMNSSLFNEENPTEFPIYGFPNIEEVRQKFAPGTKILIAIGGWGDIEGFTTGARTEESRARWAANVKKMLDITGADGADIDWEYAGGNGPDYKIVPNSDKVWEIDAFPKLLQAVRKAVGPNKILSAAVPGRPVDMIAFTSETVPAIAASLDYINVMTYDLMNRRDHVTKHHSGVELSLEAIDTYIARGLAPEKMYLGFPFYVKWFNTDPHGNCTVEEPLGCSTVLMEDPKTGADLGTSGAFTWVDPVPDNLRTSYDKAMAGAVYDDVEGGNYFFDKDANIFWSWDTPFSVKKKFQKIVKQKGLKGVFAWGLGEDAHEYAHLKALNEEVERWNGDASKFAMP